MPAGSSMPPVFVTGSAGHVGANLVRRLIDEGVRVRVLLRREDNNEGLEGLEVERAFGDIRNFVDTKRALEGCQGVYHCAAKISTIEGNRAGLVNCRCGRSRELISRLAILFSLWQCAGHGDAAESGFSH